MAGLSYCTFNFPNSHLVQSKVYFREIYPNTYVYGFSYFLFIFLKWPFYFPCIFCVSAASPRSILLDKALGESLFHSFVPHFINHHELKLRHIYQLATGGPVPACTPLHTWISLITSLALPDYSQTLPWIGLPTVCMCVCKRVLFLCVGGWGGAGCLDSWLHTTFYIQKNTSPPIPAVPCDWNSVWLGHPTLPVPPGVSLRSNSTPIKIQKELDQR